MEVCVIAENEFKALKSEILARRSISHRVLAIITKNRLRILLFTFLGIVTALFIVAALLANKGTFTVTLPRDQMINLGLVVSDTKDFERPRHEILSPPVIDIWNITRSDLPINLHELDGSNNGVNYLAMTFYLKNMGDKDLDYTLVIDLNEIYKNVDEALRVELYINGESTVYAKRKSDGSGDPEPDTEPFAAKTRIISLPLRPIDMEQIEKFTVVSWVEGEDPDCTNDLLGGFVKMTLRIEGKVRD